MTQPGKISTPEARVKPRSTTVKVYTFTTPPVKWYLSLTEIFNYEPTIVAAAMMHTALM